MVSRRRPAGERMKPRMTLRPRTMLQRASRRATARWRGGEGAETETREGSHHDLLGRRGKRRRVLYTI